jgi:hypothetical protein
MCAEPVMKRYLLPLIERGRALKPYLLYYILLKPLIINNQESVLG